MDGVDGWIHYDQYTSGFVTVRPLVASSSPPTDYVSVRSEPSFAQMRGEGHSDMFSMTPYSAIAFALILPL